MNWADFVDNPEQVAAYYDGTEGLARFSLHEITVTRNGPGVRLRGDVSRFPDRPSPRWPTGANQAQVTLSLWGLDSLEISGCGTAMVGRLVCSAAGDSGVAVQFDWPGGTVKGRCDLLRLDRITAYVKETG